MRAMPGGEFVLQDGRRLHDLQELYDALETMTDEQFHHFVTPEKHDFARWIEHSVNSKFLAARVRRTASRQALRKALFPELFR